MVGTVTDGGWEGNSGGPEGWSFMHKKKSRGAPRAEAWAWARAATCVPLSAAIFRVMISLRISLKYLSVWLKPMYNNVLRAITVFMTLEYAGFRCSRLR